MAEHEVVNSEEVEWTVVTNEDDNTDVMEGPEGPVFVAMQPGVDIPAGVEVQEVVVVTEGSETVQEFVPHPQIQQRNELPTINSRLDVIRELKREAPKIRIKKRQHSHFVTNNNYELPKATPSRGRPPRSSKNISFKRRVHHISARSPPSIRIKQEVLTSSEESDDSEEDEDGNPPPRKRPKPREFAHR